MRKLLTLIIKGYQILISPLMANHCRYTPSCSQYAVDAIEQHGPIRGLYLGTKRILRCHPWHQGGFDPVPTDNTVKPTLD
ncbi:MAG: putative membrane protein insertion efficiency factor [Gammaproteobacteria bacterium]|jgi:putative membrane protein insertion efficiency factor